MGKRIPKEFKYLQIAAVIVASLFYFGLKILPKPVHQDTGKDGGVYTVDRVVDGDTLKLSNGEKVRLLGVDTPEVHYSEKLERDAKRTKRDITAIQALGKKASAFTRSLVDKKEVRLEFDVKKRDRYGRLLAYVYLGDGTFVNAKIIEEGYAQVMTIPPNVKYSKMFLKLQEDARKNGKGLWSDERSRNSGDI